MSYISTNDAKASLKISDSSQDTLLESYIAIAEGIINNRLWVDTILKTDNKQRVKFNDYLEFYLRKSPVVSIKKIAWQTYNWVLWTDYVIENKRKVIFKNLNWYTFNYNFDTFEIEFEAWYDLVPQGIKHACLLLVNNMYLSAWKIAFDSYAIWEEKISFKSDEETLKMVDSLINLYKVTSI